MLAFQNRSRFVGLDTFSYSWQAMSFSERGERVLAEGAAACPPATPGGSAQAQLPTLPAGTQAVRIALDDAGRRRVCEWCFRVPREQTVDWPASGCATPPGLEDVYFLAGSRTNRVKNAKNRVIQGPVFDFFSPPGSSLKVTWGRMSDGSYRLDYTLSCRANVEMLGFAFPPLKDVTAERWLGGGPVWGNRMQGAPFGLWQGSSGMSTGSRSRLRQARTALRYLKDRRYSPTARRAGRMWRHLASCRASAPGCSCAYRALAENSSARTKPAQPDVALGIISADDRR